MRGFSKSQDVSDFWKRERLRRRGLIEQDGRNRVRNALKIIEMTEISGGGDGLDAVCPVHVDAAFSAKLDEHRRVFG